MGRAAQSCRPKKRQVAPASGPARDSRMRLSVWLRGSDDRETASSSESVSRRGAVGRGEAEVAARSPTPGCVRRPPGAVDRASPAPRPRRAAGVRRRRRLAVPRHHQQRAHHGDVGGVGRAASPVAWRRTRGGHPPGLQTGLRLAHPARGLLRRKGRSDTYVTVCGSTESACCSSTPATVSGGRRRTTRFVCGRRSRMARGSRRWRSCRRYAPMSASRPGRGR